MNPSDCTASQARLLRPAELLRPLKRLAVAACVVGIVAAFVALLIGVVLPVDSAGSNRVLFRLTALGDLARTLSFQLGLALFVVFAVTCCLRRRLLAALSLALALWCVYPTIGEYRTRQPAVVAGESLRVMTCNLLWTNRRADEIAAEVLAADPDVVCFQECSHRWHEELTRLLADRYPHRRHTPQHRVMGLAIYSRRDFLDADPTTPPDESLGTPLRAEITFNNQPVAIYNLHMFQPWPPRKMWHRRAQFDRVRNLLAAETLPTIVAGDFNATPTSPTMHALADLGFTDVWDQAGWGLGATWPKRLTIRSLPGIRIDHICLTHQLACTQCTIGEGPGSDHSPITATVAFRTESVSRQPDQQ